jgi:peptidoglycan/LPS O-acetylase OafA/YrhL
LTSLDGLRGVASVVVVLHHLYLVATPVITSQSGSAVGSLYWWLSETPLKLITAGTEGVLVFFVLSGLVVALPAIERASFSWAGFFSSRVVRLYFPVWAALAIGSALIWLLPRNPAVVTQGTWVETSNATSTSIASLLSQASLTRVGYGVDNVLWSLRWELVFSLLLPVFVLIAKRLGRFWLPALGIAFALTIVGALARIDALLYLPVFFIGTVLASRLSSIRAVAERWRTGTHGRWMGCAFVSAGLLLLLGGWLTREIAPSGSTANTLLGQLSVVGATALVVAAIGVRGLARFLDSRLCQWLGRVSFSLYLIHVPIIATLAFILGDQNWWLVALLTIPLALTAAWGFNVAIERPAHHLARRVSSRAAMVGAAIKKRSGVDDRPGWLNSSTESLENARAQQTIRIR